MKQDASGLPVDVVFEVRDRCLCLATQRAARKLARRFDIAFRPLGLTHGQFSMMVALNAKRPWSMMELASFLGMDRTTLTAGVATLARRKLVKRVVDPEDQRSKQVFLTPAGQKLIAQAVPIWRAEHAKLDREITMPVADQARASMMRLSA
ncbi:MarR family winged helix-turn-helix transcriptional regulator [Aestuariivirga litoralis]|uniref:MarR family winged helix-turn-helix transcriptional regulator n=1 Tax=Aestuariivirga litoralis TaxID=2650924 RepID=UPI0018C75A8B|nr:MarR family transcriptional regulator [Aestuariivirga litoralis]MBG1232617.1 MarR family transcriptional regulator [Aestuariivirga litoralis]